MSVPVRLAAFGALLALAFGVAALAGAATGPEPVETAGPAHGEEDMADGGAHGEALPVRGLATAENGLRIVDEQGNAVRDFEVEHERRMHLIVARRDLTGFQHLHPKLRADGTWVTSVRIADAGSYRMFADFVRGGEPYTLASDLRVDGPADLRPLPAPAAVDTTGDYTVQLDAEAAAPGREAALKFTIAKDGVPVETQPYLGAGGHLVALREGDLAFLHVHPTEGVSFEVTFPTAGRYRLFLQFKHENRIHTVAFTQEVDA